MTADFERFADLMRPILVQFATKYTRDACLAEDAIQEGLIGTWRNWSRIDPEGRRSYAMKAVQNKIFDAHKKSRRTPTIFELDDALVSVPEFFVAEDPDPFEHLLSVPTMNALMSVSEVDRTVMLLVADGASIKEVAAQIGVIPETAKTKIHRARQRMILAFAS